MKNSKLTKLNNTKEKITIKNDGRIVDIDNDHLVVATDANFRREAIFNFFTDEELDQPINYHKLVKPNAEGYSWPFACSFPIDDHVIMAFDITPREMLPYLNNDRHWSEVLRDILKARQLLKPIIEVEALEIK